MHRPLAVFDSGLGGLSVVRRLHHLLPNESVVYFGDTARVPYGVKSRSTVTHFARELAQFLLTFDPKLLIVACNTASALALETLQSELDTPVVGVLAPGVDQAIELAGNAPIAILATEATTACGAYPAAIQQRAPQQQVVSIACPLFVAMVEEGRSADDPITQLVVREYLAPLQQARLGACVLGCTHYPLLRDAVAAELPNVPIVDSGAATARAVLKLLQDQHDLNPADAGATFRCYVSDNPERFQRIGARFLDRPLDHIEHVPPERYVSYGASLSH